MSSARRGHVARVQKALEVPQNPDTTDHLLRTPLYLAAHRGHREVVRLLCDMGSLADVATPPFRDRPGFCPEVLTWTEPALGQSALPCPAPPSGDTLTSFKSCAMLAPTPTWRMFGGEHRCCTPAGQATFRRCSFCAKRGQMCLGCSARKLAQAMTSRRPVRQVNQADLEGNTPLLSACLEGFVDIARILCNSGVDTKQSSKSGLTPWQQAEARGFREIAKLIDAAMSDGSCEPHRCRRRARLRGNSLRAFLF